MKDIDDAVIDALVKIGNDKKVIDMTEHNVAWPFTLQRWMVQRVVNSIGLLDREWGLYKKKHAKDKDIKDILKKIKDYQGGR